jgi:hypothetical protein
VSGLQQLSGEEEDLPLDETTGSSESDPTRSAMLAAEAAALRLRLDELLEELGRRRRRGALASAARYAIPVTAVALLAAGVSLYVIRRRGR